LDNQIEVLRKKVHKLINGLRYDELAKLMCEIRAIEAKRPANFPVTVGEMLEMGAMQ
jgi:hypothetical protein